MNMFIGFSGLGCLARLGLFSAMFTLGLKATDRSGFTFALTFIILMAAILAAANLAFLLIPRERPRTRRARSHG